MATIVARKRSDGTTAYTAQIRLKRDGILIHSESKTFTKRSIAKAWATEREEQIKRDPHAATRTAHQGVTISQLIDTYIERRMAVEPLGRSKLSHLRLLPDLRHRGDGGIEPHAPADDRARPGAARGRDGAVDSEE
ncbi:MAG: hypothetical protein MZV65_39055 [Chromatiales bacterium]|nr:hypothetical protein [Chromatiales bacterium]